MNLIRLWQQLMKRNRYLWIIALVVTFSAIAVPGYSQLRPKSETLFQTSTISALLEGVYDGETTYKALKQYGDFGLGTFDALDGEMIDLEGKFYQVKADGVAYPVKDSMKTPFATVTFFKPQQSVLLREAMNYEQMQQYLDRILPTKNIPLHFITQNRKAGGHLLDFQLQNVRAEIHYTPEFKMVLPTTNEFRQADLGDGKPVEVNRVKK